MHTNNRHKYKSSKLILKSQNKICKIIENIYLRFHFALEIEKKGERKEMAYRV